MESAANSPTPHTAVETRAARPEDASAIADLYWRTRQAAVPSIPPPVHPRESVTRWIREVVLPQRHVWVATEGTTGAIVGMLVIEDPDWIHQLYVDPTAQDRGIGTLLLQRALEHTHGPARLWCFQANTAARRFYERHGFVPTVTTKGDNEEGAPDVLYVRG